MASRDTFSCSCPARVDLGELGDRRHLPQQPQRVEAALLQRTGRPGQLRGPADLAFDFVDELSNLAGGGFRLLALNADQRGFLFFVREVDIECAIDDERETHHSDEQGNVFDEQTAAYDRCAARQNGPSLAVRRRLISIIPLVGRRSHAISLTLFLPFLGN